MLLLLLLVVVVVVVILVVIADGVLIFIMVVVVVVVGKVKGVEGIYSLTFAQMLRNFDTKEQEELVCLREICAK